jgi:hypothetical protein
MFRRFRLALGSGAGIANKKGGQSIQLLTTYNSNRTKNLPQQRIAVDQNLWLARRKCVHLV